MQTAPTPPERSPEHPFTRILVVGDAWLTPEFASEAPAVERRATSHDAIDGALPWHPTLVLLDATAPPSDATAVVLLPRFPDAAVLVAAADAELARAAVRAGAFHAWVGMPDRAAFRATLRELLAEHVHARLFAR